MISSGSKILVTGGAGFLGSHLCQQLLMQGHHVVCLDNFYTGHLRNITHLKSYPRFEIIEHDVCNPISLKVDAIYHLACPASPVHYQRLPIQTIKTSVLGAINVLDLAVKHQIPVLFTSTSEVYGDPLVHPQTESYWGHVNSIGPRACYDEGKRCAETLFVNYHLEHALPIRIARIFNTYGPNMDINDGRVVSNFIRQALQNESLTLYGNGQQTRSFCYVQDTVDGLIRLMQSDYVNPVNIGNPDERTMHDLAFNILRLTQSQSCLIYEPLPIDDPKQRCPDISLAKKILNWSPKIDLKTGLEKTVNYFKEIIPSKETI